jgi:hypothetical protein
MSDVKRSVGRFTQRFCNLHYLYGDHIQFMRACQMEDFKYLPASLVRTG